MRRSAGSAGSPRGPATRPRRHLVQSRHPARHQRRHRRALARRGRAPPAADVSERGLLAFSFGANDCADDGAGAPRLPLRARASRTPPAILTEAASFAPTIMIGAPPALRSKPSTAAPAHCRRRSRKYARGSACRSSPPSISSPPANRGRATPRQGDGTHPNAAGYAALADFIWQWPALHAWLDTRNCSRPAIVRPGALSLQWSRFRGFPRWPCVLPCPCFLPVVLLAGAARAEPTGGIALYGDLKYKPDFTHFDYVNPDAPKGGAVKFNAIGTFDTFNPFTLKGVKAEGIGLPVRHADGRRRPTSRFAIRAGRAKASRSRPTSSRSRSSCGPRRASTTAARSRPTT